MPTRSLHRRWLTIRNEFQNSPALFYGDRTWTFRDLDRAAQDINFSGRAAIFPRASGPEFIVEILAGWRHGCLIVPLDKDASQPLLENPPAGYAQLKQTSATGGTSRFVKFTSAQLEADADNIVASMGLRGEWPNLGVISLAHSYGFSNLVLPLLLHGIPLRLIEIPLPEALAQASAHGSAWTLPAVPALWKVWAEAQCIPKNIKLAISAGAPLPLPLEESVYREFGLKIHNFYGSTECGGIAYDRSPSPRCDPAEIGQSMQGVQATINLDGCLEVRGPAVGAGYWPSPEPQLAGGLFKTADLAEINHNTIRLLGRSGDMINLAGRKVLPEEIERAILTHPDISDCLVFGVADPDPLRNEILVAAVVLKPSRHCVDKDLRAHVQKSLAAWQTPREWWFLDTLETNSRGKRSRSQWRDRYLRFLASEKP